LTLRIIGYKIHTIEGEDEYTRLYNMYLDLNRRGETLDEERQFLEQESYEVQRWFQRLGKNIWKPMGVVRSIEIYS